MSLQFPPKPQGATQTYYYDFTQNLAAGETISSASVGVTVFSGADSAPSDLKSGSATISSGLVAQKFTAGVVGVIYQTTCTALTSASQTLQQSALLAVVAE